MFYSQFNYSLRKENLEGVVHLHPITVIAVWTSLLIFDLTDVTKPNRDSML